MGSSALSDISLAPCPWMHPGQSAISSQISIRIHFKLRLSLKYFAAQRGHCGVQGDCLNVECTGSGHAASPCSQGFLAWSGCAFFTCEAKGHAFSLGGYKMWSKVEQAVKDKWIVLNEISLKQRWSYVCLLSYLERSAAGSGVFAG